MKIILSRLLLFLGKLVGSCFRQNFIMLESTPDISDNAALLYEEMVADPEFQDYNFIWLVKNKINRQQNIKWVQSSNRLFRGYYLARSKLIFFGNRPITKNRINQISICLCHGSKSKLTRGIYEMPKDLDYILIQAGCFVRAARYGYNLPSTTKILMLGYPRNDDLLKQSDIDRNNLFGTKFEKLIIWYPTFRQHKNRKRGVGSSALPIIHNKESAEVLNSCLATNKTLIVLKPHFAQDIAYLQKIEFENIKVISDAFFEERRMRSYQLLRMSDALLTDYSSVYYDYLLTNKPIGLVWEDFNEYKTSQGFALDPDLVYSGGEKIFDVKDFCNFIERVATGTDMLKSERSKIRDMTNIYQDAESSHRVSAFARDILKGENS